MRWPRRGRSPLPPQATEQSQQGMRTLVISDLHLGSVTGADVLRRPQAREALLEALRDVDRLVMLGDVLELRHGPLRDAMQASRPVFEDIGRALSGRELVLVAGNHDHALIEPWLALRGEQELPPALDLEQTLAPSQASAAYARIAEWAAPARTTVAYPGLWLREDVYAMHGHYLDCHLTVPTLERLSVAAMGRVLGRRAESFTTVADYESVGAPVFAWRDAVARDAHTGAALNGIATVGAWQALRGGGEEARDGRRGSRRMVAKLRRRALVAGFPLAVAALNRAGLGPLKPNISGGELRRAGLLAMGEVAARLGLGDAHVIFGHTHRTGPLDGDHDGEWRGRGGAKLYNAGNWTYSAVFLTSTPGESPYWPGGAVLVEPTGPPVLTRLLQDRAHADIRSVAAGA